MLGIWGQSCLRPPLISGTLKVVGARSLHASQGSQGLRSLRFGIPTMTPSFRRAWTHLPAKRFNSTQTPPPTTSPTPPQKRSLFSRFIPKNTGAASGSISSSSSFKKIVALAKPEWKPLTIAIGLLLMSSAVSMSVPFTVGKLIDFFSTTNPVSGKLDVLWISIDVLRSKYLLDSPPGKLVSDCCFCSRWVPLRTLDVQC